MSFPLSRRSLLSKAGVILSLPVLGQLTACGSGSVVSALSPKRILTVGDGFMDVGQNGYRFTINDGSLNWVEQFAEYWGIKVEAANNGGFAFAQGHARVTAEDTSSGTNAPSIATQVDLLLSKTSKQEGDVLLISGGIADIKAAVADTGISAASTQAVVQAAVELANQVKKLVAAGFTHVCVPMIYNLGLTPWARSLDLAKDIEALTTAFNDRVLIELVNYGSNVLTFDSALLYNLMYNRPENFPISNVKDAICISDSISSCNDSTLIAGANKALYMWADDTYLTPAAQRLFANENYTSNAISAFRNRW